MKKKILSFLTLMFVFVFAFLLVGCDLGNSSTSTQGDNSTTEIHEHTWKTPTYKWSADYSTCTAKRVCKTDSTHIESEIANSTYEVVTEQTETTQKLVKYIATFENAVFKTQTVERCELPSLLNFTLNSDNESYSVSAVSTDNCINVVIPDTYNNLPVTSIGDYAFQDCTFLTTITIGNSVTSIGDYAFQDCTSLTSITIPDSVTSIGSCAFLNCTSLTSITIGNSVTSIVYGVFYNCTSLTSITIGNSVTSIGDYAFQDCGRLVEVINKSSLDITVGSSNNGCVAYYAKQVITDEKDSKLSKDENGFVTYNDGTDIWLISYEGSENNLSIPNNITKINLGAFGGCRSLTNITIPDSVTSIGKSVFVGCTSLTSITIPDSVTSIGINAFWDCTSLTSITIGNSVTSIGESAFGNCYRLVEVINKSSLDITVESSNNGYVAYYAKQVITDEKDSKLSKDENGFVTYNDGTDIWLISYEGSENNLTIPNNITKINQDAFNGCMSLTNITIPDSVTSIGDYVFRYCKSLTTITIGNSVTSIGDYAFRYCTSLTTITIGNSVTSIGDYAFYYCTSLATITFNGTMEEWNNITKGSYWKLNVPATKVICSDGEKTL